MTNVKASIVLLIVFAIIVMASKQSDAAESVAEVYWKTKVGAIPMPKSLRESLQTGDEIVKINNKEDEKNENELWFYSNDYNTTETEIYANLMRIYKMNYSQYSQFREDHRPTYFTTDKSFGVGKKLKIYFKKIDSDAKFLPLNVAKSLPFTSDKIQQILNILSIKPKSIVAERIDMILKSCEHVGVKDEVRHCVTSLEDMVDFATSNLNTEKNKLMVVTSEQNNDKSMEYTMSKVEKLGGDAKDNVVCHKINNPFVVYICHIIRKTNVYNISLVGADGKQTKAVATCHMDTSSWIPSHRAFRVLKTKPGGIPVCHFITADSIAWVPI